MVYVVIYHLYHDEKLSESDSKLYLDTKEWLEQNLPNPPYHDDNNSVNAVTWFKNVDKVKDMLIRLEPFLKIAEKYKIEIFLLK